MTRRSTGPMPSWPRITAAWSTRPGAEAPGQAAGRAPDALCPGHVLAGPGVHVSLAQMQAEARAGRPRSPGSGAAGRWTAPPRRRCSRRPKADALRPLPGDAVRAGHVVDGARSARTSTSRSARPCTRCRGGTSARPLDARVTGTMVQLFTSGELVKTHARKPRGKQTDFGDYPPEKIAFHMRTPAWCRRQAAADRPGLRPR